jgi:hypothetical protein
VTRAEAGQLQTRYFQGELSPGEQAQLTDALLSDQDLFDAFAEEAIFTELLAGTDFRAKVSAAIQPQSTGIARIAVFLKSLDAGWLWAGAAAMVALVLLTAVILFRGRPVSAPLHQPAPAVLTVLLTPTERNAAAPRVVIGEQKTVRLWLNAPEGSYTTYRALLKAVDGPVQREFHDLLPHPGPAGARHLELEFPAALLSAGDYTLEVFGVTSAGAAEPAAGYGFSIVRKK